MKSLTEQGKLLSLSACSRVGNHAPHSWRAGAGLGILRTATWKYFRPPPVIFSAVLAMLTGWAAWLAAGEAVLRHDVLKFVLGTIIALQTAH